MKYQSLTQKQCLKLTGEKAMKPKCICNGWWFPQITKYYISWDGRTTYWQEQVKNLRIIMYNHKQINMERVERERDDLTILSKVAGIWMKVILGGQVGHKNPCVDSLMILREAVADAIFFLIYTFTVESLPSFFSLSLCCPFSLFCVLSSIFFFFSFYTNWARLLAPSFFESSGVFIVQRTKKKNFR